MISLTMFLLTLCLVLVHISAVSYVTTCPIKKCSNCETNNQGQVIKATCTDALIQNLPNSLVQLYVSDALPLTQTLPFGSLHHFMFDDKHFLEVLKIENYQISTIEDGCFLKSTNLKSLDLSKNFINVITEKMFEGLPNLEYLNLNRNNLTAIGEFVFRPLTNLKELNIAMNWLISIEENSFKGLTNVTKIDLQSNSIRTMHKKSFTHLQNLESINLQNNKLVSINAGVFSHLPKLKVINLRRNILIDLDPKAIVGTTLTSLNIAQNHFLLIPTSFLQTASNTKLEVNLARNAIFHIKNGDLNGVNLKTLYLVANKISHIQSDAFRNCFIQKLDLEQNLLRSLPQSLEKYLNQSNTVLLGNNPWSCDCDLRWIANIIKNSTQEPVCVEPRNYFGWGLLAIFDDLRIACENYASIPVPTRFIPVPPKLNPKVTPHLDRRTVTLTTTNTVAMATTEVSKLKSINSSTKGDKSSATPIIVGIVVTVFVLLTMTLLIYLVKCKATRVRVAPDLKILCRKPDSNRKCSFKQIEDTYLV